MYKFDDHEKKTSVTSQTSPVAPNTMYRLGNHIFLQSRTYIIMYFIKYMDLPDEGI